MSPPRERLSGLPPGESQALALTAARRIDVFREPLGEGAGDWLAFLIAAGVPEERDGAYRAAPETRTGGGSGDAGAPRVTGSPARR
jgi:hypothetical protein